MAEAIRLRSWQAVGIRLRSLRVRASESRTWQAEAVVPPVAGLLQLQTVTLSNYT